MLSGAEGRGVPWRRPAARRRESRGMTATALRLLWAAAMMCLVTLSWPLPLRAEGEGGAKGPSFVLDRITFRLPTATAGTWYQRQLMAEGGQGQYIYQFVSGEMPKGLELDTRGRVRGIPMSLGSFSFTATATDASGQIATQTYTLRVISPPKVEPPPTPPTPPTPTPTPTLPTRPPLPRESMPSFSVEQATFDALFALPEEDPDSDIDGHCLRDKAMDLGAEEAEAVRTKLQEVLNPLIGVEFPERELCLEAVRDAWCRSCSHHGAAESCQNDSRSTVIRVLKGSANAVSHGASTASLADPNLPPPLSSCVAELCSEVGLKQVHDSVCLQGPSAQVPATPPPRAVKGCRCGRPEIQQDLIGFYWAKAKPLSEPLIDYEVLSRVSIAPYWIGDKGDIKPALEEGVLQKFSDDAQRHLTWVDLALYRNDWAFLERKDSAEVTALARRVGRNAVELLKPRLVGAWAKAYVPGFSENLYIADGLTVYLAGLLPKDTKHQIFAQTLISDLISRMQAHEPRPLRLNLIVSEDDLTAASSNKKGEDSGASRALSGHSLYSYLIAAERPRHDEDMRVESVSQPYQSNTNVSIRFLVLLKEPTSAHKKALHAAIDQVEALSGSNRRLFVRRVIPIVVPGASDLLQFKDDMATFADVYGGAGFWPAIGLAFPRALRPVKGNDADAKASAEPPPPRNASIELTREAVFSAFDLSGETAWTVPLLGFACIYRWPLRVVGELCALGFASWTIWWWLSGRFEGIRHRALITFWLSLVAIVCLWLFILLADPSLEDEREGNDILFVILGLTIFVFIPVLAWPRAPKP